MNNVFFKSFLGEYGKKGRAGSKKKRSAPQTGSILLQIIILLPPNLGEDQKIGLRLFFLDTWNDFGIFLDAWKTKTLENLSNFFPSYRTSQVLSV